MVHRKDDFFFFSGRAHPKLAEAVAKDLGITMGRLEIETFPDGETSVRVAENVRGKTVFILQSVVHKPNEFLVELLIIIDALKRASAREICAVIPYYGYSRQDRKDESRVPITAKLVANMLESAGATRVVTMDLHAGQVQGFFDIPVDNLHARPVLAKAAQKQLEKEAICMAPDVGSAKLASAFADELGLSFGVIGKRRVGADSVEVTSIVGHVEGRQVFLIDDMCSTGGTLASATAACLQAGAKKVFAVVTHGIFVCGAWERLKKAGLEKIFVSNTIPLCIDEHGEKILEQVSIAGMLAEAVRRIYAARSVSSMFEGHKSAV